MKDNTIKDYTASHVADKLICSPQTVRALCKAGKLKHYKIGERGLRITQEALDEFRNSSN